MLCKNCGAELPEGSSFCGACGSKQEAPAQNPVSTADNSQPVQSSQQTPGYSVQFNINSLAIGNISGMRLIGVIVMALVALFSITKYMYFEMMTIEYGFNFSQLFGGELLSGNLSAGYKIFMYIILISNVAVLAGCAGYLVFSFLGGPAANSSQALQKCVLFANITFIALIVGIVACFILPSPIPSSELTQANQMGLGSLTQSSAGYRFQGWLSIILAVATRFYILPNCIKDASK